MIKKIISVSLVAMISGFMPTALALADDVSNNLDTTVDASLEVMSLTMPGSGVVAYKTHPVNGDGDTGCNLGSGEAVTFNVVTGNPSVATISPTSITFTGPGCNDTKNVTVTAAGVGSTTITLTQGANTTGGTYTLATASFTVNVAGAPVVVDTTKPVITGTKLPLPNANGWNNTNVVVDFTCADEPGGSGIATNTVAGATLTTDGAGQSVTNTGTCIDAAGNVANSATVSGINIDKTDPVVAIVDLDPDVTNETWGSIDYSITETNPDGTTCLLDGSSSNITSCTMTGTAFTGLSDGSHTLVVTHTDKASNEGSDSYTWFVDTVKPVITGSVLPLPNENGWNNTDVIVTFECADEPEGSGIGTDTVMGETVTTEGIYQSVTNTGTCVDNAGNVADSITMTGINIDKTNPGVTITDGPLFTNLSGGSFDYSIVETNPHTTVCTIDGLGTPYVVACTLTGMEFTGLSDGEHTLMVTHTDMAGNEDSDSFTWTIDTVKPVISGSMLPLPNVNGWNNTDVTVSFICADNVGGSGIATDTVAGATLTTDGAGQSVTNTGTCVDVAGNVADEATVSGINIDKTAPVVTVTTPANGGSYLKNSILTADWSADDALSGIDTVTATAPNGSSVSTSTTGNFSFGVTATDLAGNSTTVTNNYIVFTYVFGGFGKPVSLTSKEFKQTSTIPVKFQLLNSVTGLPVQGPVATLKVNGNNAVASGNANYLNQFRYDASAKQYVYNLSTKTLTLGTNVLSVTVPDVGIFSTTVIIK